MTDYAIETFELRKVYNEEKVAVQGLTLQVKRGEVFGYLGPNGAGKTTSIKMLLGLVSPTSGRGLLLGQQIGTPPARAKVGFLPEHFRFHEWMQVEEFLDFHGKLYGMSKAERAERIPYLLDLVELSDVGKKRLGNFSKGMTQRAGLAMALMPKPDIVFLDEPTSGLDPFGRLLVRDVIRTAREEGSTVFLNSHLLGEVEVTCDRVAFIRAGRVVKAGSIDELSGGLVRVIVKFEMFEPHWLEALGEWGREVGHEGNPKKFSERAIVVNLPDESYVPQLVDWLVGQGIRVYGITPQRLSLEDLFVQIMGNKNEPEQTVKEMTAPIERHEEMLVS